MHRSAENQHYSRFVEILFVVAVTLGIQASKDIFYNYLSISFWLLVVAITVIGLSWVFWNKSVSRLPYRGGRYGWIRFFSDVFIAITYTPLILSVDSFEKFGFWLAVIYILYFIHGFFTVKEHGWFTKGYRPTSVPILWLLFGLYFLIFSFVLPKIIEIPEWLVVIMYIIGVFTSRYLRHRKKEQVARKLSKIKLHPKLDLAVDIDGVLADQVPHVLNRAEKELGVKMSKKDITEWDTHVGSIPFDQLIAEYLEDPDFVRNMPVMEGSREAMETLSSKVKIKVASSRPEETEEETIEWFSDEFGWTPKFINTSSTGKSDLDANILIDDNLDNVKNFVQKNHKNQAILFSQLWNKERGSIQDLIDKGKIFIADGWREVQEFLSL